MGAGERGRPADATGSDGADTAPGAPAGVLDLSERRRRAAGGMAWRALVPLVRDLAAELARAGVVVVTQGDRTVDVVDARGPVRIRRGPRWSDVG